MEDTEKENRLDRHHLTAMGGDASSAPRYLYF